MIAHEVALHFAAQGIIGVERDDLGFVPQRQLGVPTRQGGLGLHVPNAQHGDTAFIAGAAIAQDGCRLVPSSYSRSWGRRASICATCGASWPTRTRACGTQSCAAGWLR